MIKAVEGGVGRCAIAPEILLAMWLYATLEGVGSARAIARLALEHDAYRRICGGVPVNYHTVADFRSLNGAFLDALLSDNVAALMAAGVVKRKAVAQDGMRVRASAGAASFRREDKLKGYLEEAWQRVEALRQQVDEDPGSERRRAQAARQRAVCRRLLSAAARKGMLPSSGSAGIGIQVDPHTLPMLEDADIPRRDHLPQRIEKARVTTIT